MEIKTKRYRFKHEGKSETEIAFYKTYQKYPTKKELEQWLPWYSNKQKIDQYKQYEY